MKLSSNLEGKTNEEIVNMAREIASESFIKNGNKAEAWTDSKELGCLVGGRWDSYPQLSKFVVVAYTSSQANSIIFNS